jgi:hypothetical protein
LAVTPDTARLVIVDEDALGAGDDVGVGELGCDGEGDGEGLVFFVPPEDGEGEGVGDGDGEGVGEGDGEGVGGGVGGGGVTGFVKL